MSGNDVNPYQPFESDEEPLDIHSETELPPQAPAPDPDAGSRPADGARQASPGEILSEDFGGGENAGDFLGLDLDFEAPPAGDPNAPPSGVPSEDIQLGSPPAMDGPGTDAPADTPELAGGIQAELSTDTTLPAGLSMEPPLGEVDLQPEPEEYTDSYGEEGEEDEFGELAEGELEEEAPTTGRGRMAILTVAVMGVAFAGVWFGRDYLPGSKGNGGAQVGPQVAQGTRVPTPTNPNGGASGTQDPVVVDTAPVEGPNNPAGDPVAIDPLTPDGTGPQGRPVDPTDMAVQEDALVGLTDFLHGVLVEGEGAPTDMGQGPAIAQLPTQNTDPVGLDPLDPMGQETPDAALFESLDWADPGALDIVWRGTRVPMEAIASPAKVMLPRVGRVRLHLDSGETMDGRIVAVGQASVWIQTESGRIGLGADRVAEIQHLQEASFEGDATRVAVASGDEVRVALPGGSIFARVLSKQEGLVTVQTESGAKITLRDPEMERVKSTRVHVVELPEQP